MAYARHKWRVGMKLNGRTIKCVSKDAAGNIYLTMACVNGHEAKLSTTAAKKRECKRCGLVGRVGDKVGTRTIVEVLGPGKAILECHRGHRFEWQASGGIVRDCNGCRSKDAGDIVGTHRLLERDGARESAWVAECLHCARRIVATVTHLSRFRCGECRSRLDVMGLSLTRKEFLEIANIQKSTFDSRKGQGWTLEEILIGRREGRLIAEKRRSHE